MLKLLCLTPFGREKGGIYAVGVSLYELIVRTYNVNASAILPCAITALSFRLSQSEVSGLFVCWFGRTSDRHPLLREGSFFSHHG